MRVVIVKKEKTYQVLDVAVPAEHRFHLEEKKNWKKYGKDLIRGICKL